MFVIPGGRRAASDERREVSLHKMTTAVTAPLSSLLFLLLGSFAAGVAGAAGADGATCANATLLAARLDALLAEYDRGAPPSSRLSVLVSLDMRHASIDERTSTVRLLADLRLSWEDARVAWDAPAWGCGGAPVPAERLWLPDVVPVSAVTRGPAAAAGERARLTSAGLVTWTSRLDLSAPVALRLEAWPRDVHTVIFKFASRDHDSDQLNLTISDAKYAIMFESGAWELTKISHSEERWRRGGGERRVATWSVSLRRRAPAHLLATRSVLAAAALLMLSALLLPPADRPPLFACASFTAALWLIAALVRLPASATSPLVLRALGAACACAGGGAACAALVRRVARVRARTPRTLRAALAAASPYCNLTPEQCSGEVGAWAAAAQLLDYALQALLLLAIFIIVCVSL